MREEGGRDKKWKADWGGKPIFLYLTGGIPNTMGLLFTFFFLLVQGFSLIFH